jgi:hypothetical protein
MSVDLLQAHRLRAELRYHLTESFKEHFEPSGKIVSPVAWQADHSGFQQLGFF